MVGVGCARNMAHGIGVRKFDKNTIIVARLPGADKHTLSSAYINLPDEKIVYVTSFGSKIVNGRKVPSKTYTHTKEEKAYLKSKLDELKSMLKSKTKLYRIVGRDALSHSKFLDCLEKLRGKNKLPTTGRHISRKAMADYRMIHWFTTKGYKRIKCNAIFIKSGAYLHKTTIDKEDVVYIDEDQVVTRKSKETRRSPLADAKESFESWKKRSTFINSIGKIVKL
jgi:hypothetical protein